MASSKHNFLPKQWVKTAQKKINHQHNIPMGLNSNSASISNASVQCQEVDSMNKQGHSRNPKIRSATQDVSSSPYRKHNHSQHFQRPFSTTHFGSNNCYRKLSHSDISLQQQHGMSFNSQYNFKKIPAMYQNKDSREAAAPYSNKSSSSGQTVCNKLITSQCHKKLLDVTKDQEENTAVCTSNHNGNSLYKGGGKTSSTQDEIPVVDLTKKSSYFTTNFTKSQTSAKQDATQGQYDVNYQKDYEQPDYHVMHKQRNWNEKKIHRKWINGSNKTLSNQVPSSNSNSFSVISYNILSQKLLELNRDLYHNCDPTVLPWDFRWKNLKNELESFNVDIMCLQEVEDRHYYKDIKPWLEQLGYSCVYKKRSGSEISKPDGVLTAFRTNKFEICKVIPVEYYRPHNSLTDFHNIGLILVLRSSPVGTNNATSTLLVGNTHLLYNPKRGDVKLIQLATFFAEIDKVMTKAISTTGIRPPIILCGDFNSTPFSPLFRLITQGRLKYKDILSKSVSGQFARGARNYMGPNLLPSCLHIKDDCTFMAANGKFTKEDPYTVRHRLGPLKSSGHMHKQEEATTMQDNGITVDYIFYSCGNNLPCRKVLTKPVIPGSLHKNVDRSTSSASARSLDGKESEQILELEGRFSPCTGHEILNASGLPNKTHSSDHIPVIALFAWKSRF